MSTYAIESIASGKTVEEHLNKLREAHAVVGGAYIHRLAPDAPFLLVCNPRRTLEAEDWLRANGWTPLPHVSDISTAVGDMHTLLRHHAADVAPDDNTVAVLKKIVAATGMRCFHPFR